MIFRPLFLLYDKFSFYTDGVIKNVRNPYDGSIKPFFPA